MDDNAEKLINSGSGNHRARATIPLRVPARAGSSNR